MERPVCVICMREAQNELGVGAGRLSPPWRRAFPDLVGFVSEQMAAQPWNSVNFMVAHDGFTLKDLYSCNSSNNSQACPFGPSDGGSYQQHSWDQGGAASDQRRAARTGLAFLMPPAEPR